MNTERLTLMIDMLKEVEAGTWRPTDEESIPMQLEAHIEEGGVAFNMHTWGALYDDDEDEVEVDEAGEYSCGYSACAVGHALLDSRFEGLYNSDYSNPNPSFEDHSSWIAVRRYFDINDHQAGYLFDDSSYREGDEEEDWAYDRKLASRTVTPTMVRLRIESFIESGGEIHEEA